MNLVYLCHCINHKYWEQSANLPDDGISSHHEIAIVHIHHTCFEKF